VPSKLQPQLLSLRDLIQAEVVPVLSVELDGTIMPAATVKIAEIEVVSGRDMTVKYRVPTAEALSYKDVQVATLSESARALIAEITRLDFRHCGGGGAMR
jgi:hypothetical protein